MPPRKSNATEDSRAGYQADLIELANALAQHGVRHMDVTFAYGSDNPLDFYGYIEFNAGDCGHARYDQLRKVADENNAEVIVTSARLGAEGNNNVRVWPLREYQ